MKKLLILFFISILLQNVFSAPNPTDTRLVSRPGISADKIAFIYAGRLWTADTDGSDPKEIAIATPDNTDDIYYHPDESRPYFSPDRKYIAFSSLVNDNVDVYVVPVEGGTPKRLTYHPKDDVIQGWTPDGKSVIFVSQRDNFFEDSWGRYFQLFKISVNGGFPEKINLPSVTQASVSDNGKQIAYNPLPRVYFDWKKYKGGATSDIWVYDIKTNKNNMLFKKDAVCNDINHIWLNDMIYFLSDRNGEFNLYSFNINTNEILQLTDFKDFPVVNASGYKDKIIFEQAGYIHIYDINKKESKRLVIGINTELPQRKIKWVSPFTPLIMASFSPDCKWGVFEIRGELFKIDRNSKFEKLTGSSGATDRYPEVSPDGKKIAYFSDKSGEYQLYIIDVKEKKVIEQFDLSGGGYFYNIIWSPDSKKIVYKDCSDSYYIIDLFTGRSKKLNTSYYNAPNMMIYKNRTKSKNASWSLDSNYFAYTNATRSFMDQIFIYSVFDGKSYPVTDGMNQVDSLSFDQYGDLYFLSSINAGPCKDWFNISTIALSYTNSFYYLSLKDNLFLTKKIPDDIYKNAVPLPIPAGDYSNLTAGNDGNLYFISGLNDSWKTNSDSKIVRYDIKTGKTQILKVGAVNYFLGKDPKNIISFSGKQFNWVFSMFDYEFINTSKKDKPVKITFDKIKIKIDPSLEWAEMLKDAWRINRDFFYDPAMHGVNWKKIFEKYSPFISDCATDDDFYKVMQWMNSELCVGHHFMNILGIKIKKENIGLLGADYEIKDNKYRFKKILSNNYWFSNQQLPLGNPQLNINNGDYIIKVNAKEVTTDKEIYSYFIDTGNKLTEIEVSDTYDGKKTRKIKVIPVTNETNIRQINWVEGNRDYVSKKTNGKIGYLWVPNEGPRGLNYFLKYYYPQSYKDGLIVDGRFNGGGCNSDTYIDVLSRKFICYQSNRYGEDELSPQDLLNGPKVMIINELAGSAGDSFPWIFKKFGIGKIVGKRTLSAFIGNTCYPSLKNGTLITAPNLAFWDKNGWILENTGVSPDIEV